MIKIKVKASGKDAKKVAQAVGSQPDASGANYVSRNDLHVGAGASSGVTHSSTRVPYKARPGIGGKSEPTPELVGGETAQVAHPGTGSLSSNISPTGFGPSYVGEDIDTVKVVDRQMNPVERKRQLNNRTRDQRTNLGRGKPAVPEID